MTLTDCVLKLAAPLPRIEDSDRFLFIGPHPDDIEIGAGATAAKLAAAGKTVAFLICMDGRYGLEHAPQGTEPAELIEIRRKEALASARMLGVEDVSFLNLSDGGFYEREELLRGIAREIGRFRPDCLFAPDPSVDSECHVDHRRCGEIARQLAFFAPFREIMERYGAEPAPVRVLAFYMTARPNRYVRTAETSALQLRSIFDCHRSQFPEGCAEGRSIRLYLKLRALDFGLRCGCRRAEGFRVLGRTQMHCLPEAGKP
ncbi:MAG: PIG-L family deacetylase [Oscillospiraceae bacterium]|nr:PIG-L family deacetylase [Oscillospiraceae bacterium]